MAFWGGTRDDDGMRLAPFERVDWSVVFFAIWVLAFVAGLFLVGE